MAVWSVPKLGTELLELFEPVLDSVGIVSGVCVIIDTINCVLVCMSPKMAIELGSTKWNRCLVSGLPKDSPLLCFGTVKNSPGLYELDQKRPCVVCMKSFEVNGLSCVEINRLMHELNVLT